MLKIITMLFLLIPALGQCQAGLAVSQSPDAYPFQSKYGKDTVAILHIKQVRYLNQVYFVQYGECREERDSLRVLILKYRALSEDQKLGIENLKGQIKDLKAISDKKGEQLRIKDRQLEGQRVGGWIKFAFGFAVGYTIITLVKN